MLEYKRTLRPTIGILPGWQIYEGYVHGFLDLVLRGIYSAAQEHDCNLLVACGMGNAIGYIHPPHPAWPVGSAETDFVPVGPWNTDGLIVIDPLMNRERSRYIQQIRKEGRPVVFVGLGEKGQAVVPDNESGIRQAVAHLVQHGHRRIAFIAGHKEKEDGDSIKRLRAYQAAVREYGLENDPNLTAYGLHGFNGGRRAMKQLLESGVPFRAVLASNDQSAFGAISVLREAGLRIPQDIAIIGFDDWPEAAGQEPPLTTVHYPIVEAGRKALALLLETINGHSTGDETVQIPVQLIVRESCGCLPGKTNTVVPSEQVDAHTVSTQQLTRSMVEAIGRETRFLVQKEIEALCIQLEEAFVHSLQEGDTAIFRTTFLGILHRAEEVEDDPTIWHSALLLLEQGGSQLPGTWDSSSTRQAGTMLNQARVDISASVQKQHAQYISKRGNVADQIGLLTSRLFTAVDEGQIFEMLREFLPKVGIGRADIGFYETEGKDPVAWSRLYPVSNSNQAHIRFPSCQFPPEGLYPLERPFSLALFPVINQGQVDGFIAFDSLDLATCVTIVRQLIAAFRSIGLYREAVEGRKLAEDASGMKSRFLASVSHELRTPLNVIVGLGELMLREQARGKTPAAQDLERVYSSAQHLGYLIRDVLDLASSQAGQLRLTCEALDIVETLQMTVISGEQLAQAKGLAWEARLPPAGARVWGDRTRLRQVVLNLIVNAVKFTAHGSVTLAVDVTQTHATISVSDTGVGVPLDEQAVIFDEFRQSERTTARGYGGLGLGLAVSRHLVELHGGTIGVKSSGVEGEGATFYFILPLLIEMKIGGESARRSSSQKVMLVTDQPVRARRVQKRLREQGVEVEIQKTVNADLYERLGASPPVAVLLDQHLAAEHSWDIVKSLKEHPATQEVPLIIYALDEGSQNGSVLELDYRLKPLSADQLSSLLSLPSMGDNPPQKILLVDDDPSILDLHTRLMQAQLPTCQVLQANNGRAALEMVEQTCPDLILLDLMMPELDGFSVLERLRAKPDTRDIPVVVLTAQILSEADMSRLSRGVVTVLEKGVFNAEEMMKRVMAALARTGRLGSATQQLARKAMAYIHTHYTDPIGREEIARHVGVSENYLTNCFQREMGISPVGYLNRYRVKQARILLESGEYNVTEVAMAVGFPDPLYFSRVFQREVGKPPGLYRTRDKK